jgi:hypothetical protein
MKALLVADLSIRRFGDVKNVPIREINTGNIIVEGFCQSFHSSRISGDSAPKALLQLESHLFAKIRFKRQVFLRAAIQ